MYIRKLEILRGKMNILTSFFVYYYHSFIFYFNIMLNQIQIYQQYEKITRILESKSEVCLDPYQ